MDLNISFCLPEMFFSHLFNSYSFFKIQFKSTKLPLTTLPSSPLVEWSSPSSVTIVPCVCVCVCVCVRLLFKIIPVKLYCTNISFSVELSYLKAGARCDLSLYLWSLVHTLVLGTWYENLTIYTFKAYNIEGKIKQPQ